jgi:hypothetical protein
MEGDRADAPLGTENLKAAVWRLAVDVKAQANQIESTFHAVERVPSEGRGKPAQFTSIRFVPWNKLTKDDRLLAAFDALTLSEVLGRNIHVAKIIHGEDHAALQLKVTSLRGNCSGRFGGLRQERATIESAAKVFEDG